MQYNPDGSAVAIDGVATRTGVPPHDVWLDAKDRKGWIAFRNEADSMVQRRLDSDLAEARRQIDALPDNTVIEWHYSDPYHAAFIRARFAENGIDEDVLRIVYTPRPR